jgi:hypothetical protein
MLDRSKKHLYDSARGKWEQRDGKTSRELTLTQEERGYLARYLRWERSLEPAPDRGPYEFRASRRDPEFPEYFLIAVDPPSQRRKGKKPSPFWWRFLASLKLWQRKHWDRHDTQ